MDPEDIIIEDNDPRNGRVRVIRQNPGLRPGTYPQRPAYMPAPTRYVPQQQAYYPPQQQAYYPPQQQAYYPPVIVPRPRRLADVPIGEVIALAAKAFSALRPLPTAPAPVGDTETDVSNLITFQSSLAGHAKSAERIHALGALGALLTDLLA